MADPQGYCTLDDVNALVPQAPFGDRSTPTGSQVELFIVDITARMDATLQNLGYQVPVTGEGSLRILKRMASYGAAGLAQMVRETAVTVATTDRNNTASKNIWMRMFEEELCRLSSASDPFELPDAPRNDEQVLKQPENLLQSYGDIDADRMIDNVVITRDQTL